MPPENPYLHLERNAQTNPRGIFIRSADATVTNAEAVVLVKQIAFELRRIGVRPGNIVDLDLPDQLGALMTEALYHEGAIGAVVPPEVAAHRLLDVDWVISSRGGAAAADGRTVEVDQRFLRRIEENPTGIRPTEESPDAVRIVFSSGTTGTPNAIPLTRRAMSAFDGALETWFQGDPFLVLMDLATPWGFGGFYLSVQGGRPFLSSGGATQAGLVRLVDENSVTSLKGSPAQVSALVAELESQGRSLPTVESVWVGGTVMPPGVAERARRVFDGCAIECMYGSTEATIATVKSYSSDDPSDAGQPVDGSDLEVVDEWDRPVPVGRAGRIRHRSAAMVDGYLGDPDSTARAFRDGWFYPGDLGILRADGGLTLTGRESEVLNAGGVKVDPTRIDLVALGLAGVRDACAFEHVSATGLREIGLAVVADHDLDSDQLVAGLRTELGVAAPRLVVRIDAVPRNAMGKAMRRTLTRRFDES